MSRPVFVDVLLKVFAVLSTPFLPLDLALTVVMAIGRIPEPAIQAFHTTVYNSSLAKACSVFELTPIRYSGQ